jgi:hypothetical protein
MWSAKKNRTIVMLLRTRVCGVMFMKKQIQLIRTMSFTLFYLPPGKDAYEYGKRIQ